MGGWGTQKFCANVGNYSSAIRTQCPKLAVASRGRIMNSVSIQAPRTTVSTLAIPFALASVFLLWGSTYLAIRVALPGYPPFLLGAVRMSLAGALMYAALRLRVAQAPTSVQWRAMLKVAVVLV